MPRGANTVSALHEPLALARKGRVDIRARQDPHSCRAHVHPRAQERTLAADLDCISNRLVQVADLDMGSTLAELTELSALQVDAVQRALFWVSAVSLVSCGLVLCSWALNADLRAILRGAVPRAYGEAPENMGAYKRIAPDVPGVTHHGAAMKLKRSHFRSAQQQQKVQQQ